MHIALVTEAWHPQINGVVHTWSYMQRELQAVGHRLTAVTPMDMPTMPVPGEPDIRLALWPWRRVREQLAALQPDALHIATEGPLGWAARRCALRWNWPFTTSYHTRFPEYFERRFCLPLEPTYTLLRRFHAPSRAVLVPTPRVASELQQRGFARVQLWPRGVDAALFQPAARDALDALKLPRPIFMYVGRVAPEKNLEALLQLDLPGSTVIVGDGPAASGLRKRYPRATWLGTRSHVELPALYNAADVFVFPSRTDTFGLVMLEAMACGTPVAAFPVAGPIDVVEPGRSGILDHDLRAAALAALQLDRTAVRDAALSRGWRHCAQVLENNLVEMRHERRLVCA